MYGKFVNIPSASEETKLGLTIDVIAGEFTLERGSRIYEYYTRQFI